MPSVSVLIPTFNRAPKLARLLGQLDELLGASSSRQNWQVMVADNASPDETPELLASCRPRHFSLRWFRHERNLGADANCAFLYEQAETEYIWWFADDDVIFPGAFDILSDALLRFQPDVLRFSFVQPAGSKVRFFNFQEPVRVVEDLYEIINLLVVFPKISSFLVRKVHFEDEETAEMHAYLGSEWYFLFQCFSILGKSKAKRLCVISEPLAGVDDEEATVSAKPEAWFNHWRVYQHPFVTSLRPELWKEKKLLSYLSGINFCYNYRLKILGVSDPHLYEEHIQTLTVSPWLLFRSPIHWIKLVLAKYGSERIYAGLRRYHLREK